MGRGGKRTGAGRPIGSGKFGEETELVRVPKTHVEYVKRAVQHQCYRLPFYISLVSAGFPSQGNSDAERLDLNELVVDHPESTFLVKVSGESMLGAGIRNGDVLVVDRSLEPVHGKVVIASIDGELTVKRLYRKNGQILLLAENEAYPSFEIGDEQELHIWGVVTNVIHRL